ncbi:hypothetical protein Tco_0908166 [Tanacetum coccineum]|uniref:Integrase, catalytic region, zinc finger, CCHC-type, peptidase aspartic, catalytic n=1 Tax=Tanacetum coccineum TaxID=301880 RepID=A0ABQ5CLE3_9ASTR
MFDPRTFLYDKLNAFNVSSSEGLSGIRRIGLSANELLVYSKSATPATLLYHKGKNNTKTRPMLRMGCDYEKQFVEQHLKKISALIVLSSDIVVPPRNSQFLKSEKRCASDRNYVRQSQGKDDTIRNLDAQINIMKVLNVGSTEGSCDQQALETDRIQLKDTITSLRIQLDGLKVENVSLKRRYDELSKANTHSRTAYTEKLSAFTAENNQLKAQVTGKTSSEPSTSRTKSALAPGNVQLSEPPRPSLKPTQKPVVHPNKQTNVCVPMSTGVKPTSGASKTMNNVCGACNKSLVFANHTDCLVMCDGSVNVKPHQTKRFKRQPRKEWKPVKRVWKPISKPVANSKPQWKPTGRHFSLFEKYPLTRIMESTDMPIDHPRVLQYTDVLWYLDSGCSRHMTGDRARLINFVEKFIGTDLSTTYSSRTVCDGGLKLHSSAFQVTSANYDNGGLLKRVRTTNLYSISPEYWPEKSSQKDYPMLNIQKTIVPSGQLEFVNMTLDDGLKKSLLVLLMKHAYLGLHNRTVLSKDANRTLMGKLHVLCHLAKLTVPMLKATTKKAYRIYNKRTRKIQETVHVAFDELTEGLTSVQTSSGLAPQQMTSVPNSTELELTALQSGRSRSALVRDPEPPSVPPTKKQVDDLFQWFDDDEVVPIPPVVPITPVNVPAAPAPENAIGSPSTTVISEGAPAVTESLLPHQIPLPDTSDSDDETLFDHVDSNVFDTYNAPETASEASSSNSVNIDVTPNNQLPHVQKWTQAHPLENIIGDKDRPVSTRKQLETDAMWCFFNEFLTHVEPKTYKQALEHSCWIEAMQEEIHEL